MANVWSITYLSEKWKDAGFQKYFRNTSWMFFSKVLSMAMSFFTTMLVARRLGPINYGQLSYAISFISLFGFIASLGIDSVLYRELISSPEKKKQLLGSAIAIKLLAGTFAAVLAVTTSWLLTQDDVSQKLILILSGTFVFSSFQLISYEFQARVLSKYPALIAFVINLVLNTLKVIIVILGKGVIYLSFVLLLESILYVVFYWYAYENKFGEHISRLSFDKKTALSLLSDSWPLIFTSAFALIYGRIDQVLIKYMIGPGEVGIYSSAVTIAEMWYFLPVIIIASFFPAIVSARKISEEVYYKRLIKLSSFLFMLAVGVSISVSFLAPVIMKVIFGNEFVAGSTVLKIYVWATVGTFLGYLANNYLIAENSKSGLIIVALVPMVINVILNLLWIPKYGAVGSAWATLISYTMSPMSVLLIRGIREKLKKYTVSFFPS